MLHTLVVRSQPFSEVCSNGTVGSSAFGRHQTFCQHPYACSALSALFYIVSNFETVVPVPVERRMRRGTAVF